MATLLLSHTVRAAFMCAPLTGFSAPLSSVSSKRAAASTRMSSTGEGGYVVSFAGDEVMVTEGELLRTALLRAGTSPHNAGTATMFKD